MKADIILLLNKGIVEEQHVIKRKVTAEAMFDNLAENLLEEDYEEIKEIDYGFKLDSVNNLLRHTGKEFIWLTRIKVNKSK